MAAKGRCNSCGEPILWTKTDKGKAMPVDVVPHFAGNITLEATGPAENPVYLSHYLGRGAPWPRYRSHFATCPNANEHRKKGSS